MLLFQGLGGFNGFLISMLVAFLVSKRKIHTTMSGYQVLRSVLQFLGKVAGVDRPGVLSFHQHAVSFLSPNRRKLSLRQAVVATQAGGGRKGITVAGSQKTL